MPRGPVNFRERDIAAIIRAAQKAGVTGPIRVVVGRSGEVTIYFDLPGGAVSAPPDEVEEAEEAEEAEGVEEEANEWDEVYRRERETPRRKE